MTEDPHARPGRASDTPEEDLGGEETDVRELDTGEEPIDLRELDTGEEQTDIHEIGQRLSDGSHSPLPPEDRSGE